jgi:hypothetical protein
MKNTVTFVTSYLKIYESEYDESKTFDKRLELFIKILNLDINICIFTSPEFESIFNELAEKYHNLKVLQILSIHDLEFFKLGHEDTNLLILPDFRSVIKDHINYMFLMHAKIEFIKKTIDINPFNNSIFCWFDFSLPYIFKNIDNTLLKIKKYACQNYINERFITMPGCWNFKVSNISALDNRISWRFCGGFFLGDKESLLHFYNISITHFTEFLNLTKKIVWEVNYWSWLEGNGYFEPIWYAADHNDSIVNISERILVKTILLEADGIIEYDYPTIMSNDKFFASSASYIYDKITNNRILNTRYVNYYYKDNWDCLFFNNTRQIKTLNIKSELNDEYLPIDYKNVNIDETGLIVNNNAFSVGLEDIRLFESHNNIKFIATNINYIESGKSRMVTGDYDNENSICKNLKIIDMTWESNCEKNWSPLPVDIDSKKLFIYKWNPYTIGFVNDNNKFEIYMMNEIKDECINKFRGSTPFIEYNDKYFVGLVHYSVPAVPPVYYHSLVLLNRNTYLPEFYSEPFKFSNCPIEFCIGFTLEKNYYLFWISRMDREPILLKIDSNKIDIDKEVKL